MRFNCGKLHYYCPKCALVALYFESSNKNSSNCSSMSGGTKRVLRER